MLTRSKAAFSIVELKSPSANPVVVESIKQDEIEDDVKSLESLEKPSPIEFDKFIPWACRRWALEHITVYHKNQGVSFYKNVHK